MTICYFTATGNCLYVARRIGEAVEARGEAASLPEKTAGLTGGATENTGRATENTGRAIETEKGKLLSIPQLMRQDEILIEDDTVGIVAPVYAVEMPMMVKAFLEKARIKTDYFFFIYTYGMGYAEAFTHVEVTAQKAGLELSYINAIQMVDNYIPFFDMQEQIDTLPLKNVEGQLEKVIEDISQRKLQKVNVTPENIAEMEHWTRTHAANILKKDTALSYTVNDDCIRCGICAKVCPANNITVAEDGIHFSDHCEVCYACLHNCPKTAIHMPVEANTVRFRNEYVTVADIIQANE